MKIHTVNISGYIICKERVNNIVYLALVLEEYTRLGTGFRYFHGVAHIPNHNRTF